MKLHNIEYKDWFINQGRLPDDNSTEYKAFFNFHKEICMNGCIMDGQYINPFLYWHLNIWHTEVDTIIKPTVISSARFSVGLIKLQVTRQAKIVICIKTIQPLL